MAAACGSDSTSGSPSSDAGSDATLGVADGGAGVDAGTTDGQSAGADGGVAEAGDAGGDVVESYEQRCMDVVNAFCAAACTCTKQAGTCCALSDAGTDFFCYTPCNDFVASRFCNPDAGDRSADLAACQAVLPSATCYDGPDAGKTGLLCPPDCVNLYR